MFNDIIWLVQVESKAGKHRCLPLFRLMRTGRYCASEKDWMTTKSSLQKRNVSPSIGGMPVSRFAFASRERSGSWCDQASTSTPNITLAMESHNIDFFILLHSVW